MLNSYILRDFFLCVQLAKKFKRILYDSMTLLSCYVLIKWTVCFYQPDARSEYVLVECFRSVHGNGVGREHKLTNFASLFAYLSVALKGYTGFTVIRGQSHRYRPEGIC